MSPDLSDFDFSVFDHAGSGLDLEMRKEGMTGGDVAAVLGAHPRRTAWDVYAVKVGLVDAPRVENEATEIGTAMQLPVCHIYQKRSGETVRWFDTTIRHKAIPWMIATPDGILEQGRLGGRKGLYEGKTAGSKMVHKWGEEWTDQVPAEYRIQAAWNCIVAEADFCDFGVLLGTQPLSVGCYRVEPDETFRAALYATATDFWHNNVLARRPPRIQSSELANLWLDKRDDEADFRAPSDEELVLVKELHALQGAPLRDPRREEDVKAQLKESIAEAAGLIGPWGFIRYKRNKDTVVVDYEGVISTIREDAGDTLTNALIDGAIERNTTNRRGARPLVPRFRPDAFMEDK